MKIKFNEEISKKVVIDTGASVSCFDGLILEKYISKIDKIDKKNDLQSTGITETKLNIKKGILKKIYFGHLKLENYPIVLLDLTHINNMYKMYFSEKKQKKLQICGLIGSDFLRKFNAIIDYKNQFLTLEF
ncbi:MAG: hypothetical protein B6I24_05035 [Bacteroidetes bacterium 4572_128]|nr:MAG: hypothetical protein B6I24_05035 [Bacteroidetes bacterium 4572_128]